MNRIQATLLFALALAVLLTGLPAAPAMAQWTPPGCDRAGVDDKCEAWVVTFDDAEVAEVTSATAADVVVSPDGASVYSAMRTRVGTGWDATARWAILAHDDEGRQRWLARWGDPNHYNFVTSIAVSRDGQLVFASGTWRTDQLATDGHLATIAFDAGTGDVVWTASYDGPGGGTDNAREIVVSPDGRTLYVAGISAGRSNADLDYATIAYDAASGRELWVTRWDGIGVGNLDSPFAIDVNSRADMLYLTGWSYGEGEYNLDWGTIAIDTAGDDAGRIVWSARYDGVGVRAPDRAAALTISPDDRTVFVTGTFDDVAGGPPFDVNYGYATVAYDALSGEQLWEARKHWPDSNFDTPTAMTIDPEGRRLLVTGQVGLRQLDFGTVAYDPATGAEVWSDRYGLPEYDFELGKQLVLDPRGDTVYVGGISAKSPPGVPGVVLYAPNADAVTIAYDIETGAKRWLARFNPAMTDYVSAKAMAVSPDATKIYSVATIDDQNWDNDGEDFHAAVVAYEIGPGIPIPEPPVITELDDSDPAIEYRRGWHRRSDPNASNGDYHRRIGGPGGGGEVPTARLVFEGEEITYFFGVSEQGGTADVFLDGALARTVDYSGEAPGSSPEFGHTITFDVLGEGSHELRIVHRSGAVYVDGFEIVSGEGGGPDPSAAETRSVTTTSTGELPGLGTTVLAEAVEVGPDDEWLSVIVEGSGEPVTVTLLDPLLGIVAEATQLLAGSSTVGLDIAPALAGTYTVQVHDTSDSPATVEISIARTIAVAE